jgi:hypothetical protein
MGNMVEAAAELWSEVERAATRFKDLSDADVLCDRGPGSWVKKEILGHLIDSAANNHQRFVRAQFADPFIWPGYDQRAWVLVQRYRERPWLDLVELWATLNRHLAAVIASIPPEKLQTLCTIGDREPIALEWWIRDYFRHLKHHLAQLELD